jgi:DNA primase
VTITHPDKQLFDGIDKQDVADHYRTVAPVMLPHLRGRPLALERFPDGIDGGGFMQKTLPANAPGYVHRTTVDRVGGGTVEMIVCTRGCPGLVTRTGRTGASSTSIRATTTSVPSGPPPEPCTASWTASDCRLIR